MHAHMLGAAPTELIDALNAIGDATVPAHDAPDKLRPRYSPAGVDGLRRLVVGWNVNPRLLDLAFLVAAIQHGYRRGALDFFFSARSFATQNAFRQAVADACDFVTGGAYAIDERGLVSRHDAGAERVLWWNQNVLILPPLFELLCIIDPDSMMRECKALGTNVIGANVIRKVTDGWQKRMYHWLREMAGPSVENSDPMAPFTQQRMRHFSFMVKWLRANARDHDSPISELLNDEQVLGFWRAHWPGGSVGEAKGATQEGHWRDDSEFPADSERYRSFAFVAELAMHLWCATDIGLKRMSTHLSIMIRAGEDGGTISEDAFDLSGSDMDADTESLVRAFESPPLTTIKFLKETEKKVIEPIVSVGAAAHRLPLTLLRARIFGHHQRRLGRAFGSSERLAELLVCQDLGSYCGRVEEIRSLLERLSKLRDCCLHVLVHLSSHHAVSRIREALPDLTCWADIEATIAGAKSSRDANDDEDVLAAFAKGFFRSLSSTRLCAPDLNAYLTQLTTVFGRVNTQGFKNLPAVGAQLDGVDIADAYAHGDNCLTRLVVVIEGFLRSLDSRYGDAALQEKFISDRNMFREGFTRIYAGGDPA